MKRLVLGILALFALAGLVFYFHGEKAQKIRSIKTPPTPVQTAAEPKIDEMTHALRIQAIILRSREKIKEQSRLDEIVEKLQKKVQCTRYVSPNDCRAQLEKLAGDPHIVSAFGMLRAVNVGIYIKLGHVGEPDIFIGKDGNLYISDGASLQDMRQFLEIRYKN